MTERPRIAITLGDPSGIGPEVVAKALQRQEVFERSRPVVIGALSGFDSVRQHLPGDLKLRLISTLDEAEGRHGIIDILDRDGIEGLKFPVGELSPESGKASHTWVERAASLCRDGSVAAMVTAPINKGAWKISGSSDLGHLEVFRRMSGSSYVATMLVSGALRCMHLSTHLALRDACDYVTRQNVLRAIRLTDRHFRQWGFQRPRIAVAGLNPHASDGGLIGSEEQEQIGPAIRDARADGIDAGGPVPADSVFNQAIGGRYDVVVVMYHDQGHIAIKVHGFEESISVNLGIPWIRTSVDHGTAFDIAGQWRADETSMVEAIRVALDLAEGSQLGGGGG